MATPSLHAAHPTSAVDALPEAGPAESSSKLASSSVNAVKPGGPPPRKRVKAAPLPLVVPEAPDGPPLPWHQRLVNWFISFAAMGYGASILFHAVLLIILSLIVTAPKMFNGQMSLTAEQTEGIDTQLDSIPIGIEDAGGGEDRSTAAELANVDAMQALDSEQEQLLKPSFPSDLVADVDANGKSQGKSKGGGEGEGTGDGKGLPFAMPKGGAKVARKGSFAAWTVPSDPKPFENYRIVIQIELPDNVKRIPKRDLVGSYIKGTDGYADVIPHDTRGFLPGNAKQAQLVVFVPGASALVRDTIRVKSRLLKEDQLLEIVF